jgi:hypothetical protein
VQRLSGVIASLLVAIAMVLSTRIASQALVRVFRIRHQSQVLTVTGSAKKRIRSDLVVWHAQIESRAPELAPAYKKLSADVPKVTDFIRAQGIDSNEVVVSAIRTTELHPHDKDGREISESTIAYVLEQSVEVTSHDIDRVTRASNEATRLIEDGVYIDSEPPRYLYTKLAELKIEMLAEASKDARVRAEQMAVNMKSRVSSLQSARMGVMQINAANQTEISAEGTNDTSSLEKDIMAIVSASFGIEGS